MERSLWTAQHILCASTTILPLGYRLTESAGERVGSALAESIRRFWRKNQHVKSTTKWKQVRAEAWIKLGVKPEDIEHQNANKSYIGYMVGM